MDAHTFHEMQQAGAFEPRPEDAPADLMELLLDRYLATPAGQQLAQAPTHVGVLARFLTFARGYFRDNPVVSQGLFDGGMTLIFQDGEAVPLAVAAEAAAARPDPVYAVTQPREGRMKGMTPGLDTSVAVTGRDRPRRR